MSAPEMDLDQMSLGRFKVIEANQLLAPGKCAGCGGFTKRRFVDFGLELDFYGVVYLCLEVCFTEVANKLGFLSPVQTQELNAKLKSYRGHFDVLQDKLSKLEGVRDAIDSYHGGSSISDSVVESSDSGTVHQGSSDEGVEAEGPVDSGSETGQSGSPESIDVGGPPDVRDDDSLEQFAKEFNI